MSDEVVKHAVAFSTDVVELQEQAIEISDGYLPGLVEMVLFEVAAKGGNATAALRSLKAQYPNERFPQATTITRWVRDTHRNRYHEIANEKLGLLQAQNLAALNERQVSYNELEADLERQIRARLPELDAVGAGRVLQNVANAKKVAIEGTSTINHAAVAAADSRSIAEMARALSNLGVGTITDAEVVGEPSSSSPPS